MNKLKLDRSLINPLSNAIAKETDINTHSYDLRNDSNTMQRTNMERFKNFITVKYNY